MNCIKLMFNLLPIFDGNKSCLYFLLPSHHDEMRLLKATLLSAALLPGSHCLQWLPLFAVLGRCQLLSHYHYCFYVLTLKLKTMVDTTGSTCQD